MINHRISTSNYDDILLFLLFYIKIIFKSTVPMKYLILTLRVGFSPKSTTLTYGVYMVLPHFVLFRKTLLILSERLFSVFIKPSCPSPLTKPEKTPMVHLAHSQGVFTELGGWSEVSSFVVRNNS